MTRSIFESVESGGPTGFGGDAAFGRDIATLSEDSVHTVAPPGSEHHLMTNQPQLVIDGVCQALNR